MRGWCAVGSVLIVAGAFTGGVGATQTGRDFVRALPSHVGSWLRDRRTRIATRLRQMARWLGSRYRIARDRTRAWADRLLVKLRVRRSVTVRASGRIGAAVGMSASITVAPAPIERRIEHLEEWRKSIEQDRRTGARLLAIGFAMILSGELIRLLLC